MGTDAAHWVHGVLGNRSYPFQIQFSTFFLVSAFRRVVLSKNFNLKKI
jgi:hypothetical protein